jgi:hypothetical protein
MSRSKTVMSEQSQSYALSIPQSPVPIQGSFSYTVVGGSPPILVQFRAADSPLDKSLTHKARSIHGSLVAEITYLGSIREKKPLSVYVIEKLSGVTYLQYKLAMGSRMRLSDNQYSNQKGLVEDIAR